MSVSYRRERIDRGIKARSDDVLALSSYREILYLVLPRLLPVAVVLLFPFMKGIVGLYWEKVFVIACAIALLGLSWDLLASVGLLSLGQALFFGAGAYIAGYINHSFHLPLFIDILLGTLGGALFCTLLLLPVLRLRGIYFALITLVLPSLFQRVIEATKILGGSEGWANLSPLPNYWVEMYLPIITMLVCVFGFRRLMDTDYGLVLRGIRDNDRAVLAAGIDIFRYKAQALFIAGVPGALAGAFMTHYYQYVGTQSFALDYSILPVTAAIVGGPGTLVGTALGAFILVPVSETLRAFGTLRIAIYCMVLVGFVVGLPEGIFHYIQRRYQQFERLVSVEVGK